MNAIVELKNRFSGRVVFVNVSTEMASSSPSENIEKYGIIALVQIAKRIVKDSGYDFNAKSIEIDKIKTSNFMRENWFFYSKLS